MAPARNQLRVLELLAVTDREVAGIEVANALGELARSSFYAALAALQRDGLVTARWDVEGASHPRRLVRISAAGQRALADARAEAAAERRAQARRPAEEGAS